MNNEITVTSGEVTDLLNLINKFSIISDIYTAEIIYNENKNQKADRDKAWVHLSGLGSVLRIGYIMGQRAERKRRKERTNNG